MASSRLLFDSVTIYSDAFSTAVGTISGITVDGLEISKEGNTVAIENGLVLNESYTGSITIRTINTADDTPSAILTGNLANYISSDGSIPTAAWMQLNGTGGSGTFNVRMANVYLMGYQDYSNGRIETVIMATKESTAQTVIQESVIS